MTDLFERQCRTPPGPARRDLGRVVPAAAHRRTGAGPRPGQLRPHRTGGTGDAAADAQPRAPTALALPVARLPGGWRDEFGNAFLPVRLRRAQPSLRLPGIAQRHGSDVHGAGGVGRRHASDRRQVGRHHPRHPGCRADRRLWRGGDQCLDAAGICRRSNSGAAVCARDRAGAQALRRRRPTGDRHRQPVRRGAIAAAAGNDQPAPCPADRARPALPRGARA